MRPARFSILVDKAVEAAVAAIEVYNKPSFSYREEAFSILMINAWELLLKARILRENANQMRSIELWETVKKRRKSRHAAAPEKEPQRKQFHDQPARRLGESTIIR